jgi:predicted nuclease of restriction endonuclease-like (RecB) superfamily
VERQRADGLGKSTVERLAADLQNSFPEMKGFSPNNIWRTRGFYLAWNLEPEILARAGRELACLPALPPPTSSLTTEVADLLKVPTRQDFIARLARKLPWGRNLALARRIKDPALRVWSAQMAISRGWSRGTLETRIETSLHQRQEKALHNFSATLPPPESGLAGQILKDLYNFDFFGLGDEAQEREAERALLAHARRFLLEMGEGFALVSQQRRITVGDEDYYIDLLFYHIHPRCYVVVERKATKFKPNFVGQLNFYLSAIDDTLRREGDNPTIGLIMCKSKDKLAAEYALCGLTQPLAVADFFLTKAIPQELQGVLPTIEEIEAKLASIDGMESPEMECRPRD